MLTMWTWNIFISTHLVLLILERDFEGLGCADHGLHWSEDVLVDQFGETLLIFIGVAWPMDYSHLLDEGALATLSSALKRRRRQHRKLADSRNSISIKLTSSSCMTVTDLKHEQVTVTTPQDKLLSNHQTNKKKNDYWWWIVEVLWA